MARKLAAAPEEVRPASWNVKRELGPHEVRPCPGRQPENGVRHRRFFSRPRMPLKRDTSGGYGAGAHLFPSRTEKLSPAAAMILRETVGK